VAMIHFDPKKAKVEHRFTQTTLLQIQCRAINKYFKAP